MIQTTIDRLRDIIDNIEYLKTSDYDKICSEIDNLEQEILYREEYSDYIQDEADDNYEDLYN